MTVRCVARHVDGQSWQPMQQLEIGWLTLHRRHNCRKLHKRRYLFACHMKTLIRRGMYPSYGNYMGIDLEILCQTPFSLSWSLTSCWLQAKYLQRQRWCCTYCMDHQNLLRIGAHNFITLADTFNRIYRKVQCALLWNMN